uniref:Uncharacterized protein n=1 Tax=Vespula pensylvanica TaxID=30213 RepID=A0A834PBS2_VESPE|nr:hypothetical protein H0235_003311 [Vespula pensylvanica]
MISGNRLRTTPYGNRQNVTGMRVEFVELKNEAHPYGVTALSLGARVSARFHAVRNGFRDLGSACNSIGNSRCLIPFAVYFSLTSGDPVIIASNFFRFSFDTLQHEVIERSSEPTTTSSKQDFRTPFRENSVIDRFDDSFKAKGFNQNDRTIVTTSDLYVGNNIVNKLIFITEKNIWRDM